MGSITRTFANSITASGVNAVAPGTVAPEDTTTGTLGISAVTSDPPSPSFGEVWIRTDLKKIKSYLLGTAAWASGTSMPYGFTGGNNGGPFNATWHTSGYGSHPKTGGDNGARGYDHLFWNGTSWSIQTDYPYPNSGSFGFGTQDTHMVGGGHGVSSVSPTQTLAGGSYTGTQATYEWAGSPGSWSAETNLPTSNSGVDAQGAGAPTSDFMLAYGWTPSGNGNQTVVFTYNGTAWASSTATPRAGNSKSSGGASSSDTYFVGGGSPGNQSEYWNGSSWATGPTLNTAVPEGRASETLKYNASNGNALSTNNPNGNVELWNGTAWANDTDIPGSPYPNQLTGGAGADASKGLAFGGGSPPYPSSSVYNYTGAVNAPHEIPAFSAS